MFLLVAETQMHKSKLFKYKGVQIKMKHRTLQNEKLSRVPVDDSSALNSTGHSMFQIFCISIFPAAFHATELLAYAKSGKYCNEWPYELPFCHFDPFMHVSNFSDLISDMTSNTLYYWYQLSIWIGCSKMNIRPTRNTMFAGIHEAGRGGGGPSFNHN